jgi:hypothetical protein
MKTFLQHLMEAPMTTTGADSSKTSKGKGGRPANRQADQDLPRPFVEPFTPGYNIPGPPDWAAPDYQEPGPGGIKPGDPMPDNPRDAYPQRIPYPVVRPPFMLPHHQIPPDIPDVLDIPRYFDPLNPFVDDTIEPIYDRLRHLPPFARPVNPGGIPPVVKPKPKPFVPDIEIIIPPEKPE